MITLDLETANRLTRKVIEEKGKDYVYKAPDHTFFGTLQWEQDKGVPWGEAYAETRLLRTE